MFNFKQKDDEFFDLFLESAKFFHAGALILDEVIQDYKTTAVKVEEINKIEHEADAINDRIIDKLNLTFITPIDREDIYALANNLDDGVDLLQGILQRYDMYHMGEPMTGAVNLTKLLLSATEEIVRAVSFLGNIRKRLNALKVKAISSTVVKLPTCLNTRRIRLSSFAGKMFWSSWKTRWIIVNILLICCEEW